jgi:hypothetical protein
MVRRKVRLRLGDGPVEALVEASDYRFVVMVVPTRCDSPLDGTRMEVNGGEPEQRQQNWFHGPASPF